MGDTESPSEETHNPNLSDPPQVQGVLHEGENARREREASGRREQMQETEQLIEETRENNKETRTVEWLQLAVNFVLAVVGAIAIFVYNGQLSVMKGQLKEMDDSGKQTDHMICLYEQQSAELRKQVNSDRAIASATYYEAVTSAQSQQPYMKTTIHADDMLKGGILLYAPLSIGFDIENAGKTSARGVQYRVEARIVPKGDKAKFSYSKASASMYSALIRPGDKPHFLNPEKPLAIAVLDQVGKAPQAITPLIAQSLTDGTSRILLYGKVTYSDMFGVRHRSTFCRTLGYFDPKTQPPDNDPECTKYNQEDNSFVLSRQNFVPPRDESIPEIPCPTPKPN